MFLSVLKMAKITRSDRMLKGHIMIMCWMGNCEPQNRSLLVSKSMAYVRLINRGHVIIDCISILLLLSVVVMENILKMKHETAENAHSNYKLLLHFMKFMFASFW